MFLLRLIWAVVCALFAKRADYRLRSTTRRDDAVLLSSRSVERLAGHSSTSAAGQRRIWTARASHRWTHALLGCSLSLVGYRGRGLLFFLFLLCGFRLFGFLLPILFGLVLLAFLVAHGVTPFWCSPSRLAASAVSGHLWSRELPAIPGQCSPVVLTRNVIRRPDSRPEYTPAPTPP